MTQNTKLMLGIILGLLILVTTGCGSNMPTRFYVLTPMNNPNSTSVVVDGREIAIGVGPVELPMYLDRPQLVRRTAHNELQLSELEQWAEPLENNVPAVLAENLSNLLGTDEVNLYPWSSSTSLDYAVTLELNRFDWSSSGETVVSARWNIIDPTRRQVILTRKFHYIDQIKPGDSLAAVKSKSHALERLSQDIAEELARLSSSPDRERVSARR